MTTRPPLMRFSMVEFIRRLRAIAAHRWVDTHADTHDAARSFLSVRRAIGYVAILLPVALVVIGVALDDFRPSISGFYYSEGRDVFIAILFATGLFLISYTGHGKRPDEKLAPDYWASKVAGVAVILVAFVPTGVRDGFAPPWLYTRLDPGFLQGFHLACAAVFFLTLAYFSLRLFRRGGDEDALKRARKRIHFWCGVAILASLGLIAVFSLVNRDAPDAVGTWWHPTFWFETTATLAFAVSWLTKGRSLLVIPLERLAGAPRGTGRK